MAGRDFNSADTDKSEPVAVINREFARELFHSDDVVGQYFKDDGGRSILITGVVADGKHLRLNEDTEPAVFFPFSQWADTNTSLVVRTQPDPSGAVTKELAASIRRVIRDLDSAVPIQQSENGAISLILFFFRPGWRRRCDVRCELTPHSYFEKSERTGYRL